MNLATSTLSMLAPLPRNSPVSATAVGLGDGKTQDTLRLSSVLLWSPFPMAAGLTIAVRQNWRAIGRGNARQKRYSYAVPLGKKARKTMAAKQLSGSANYLKESRTL
jgi:hypothetical protein